MKHLPVCLALLLLCACGSINKQQEADKEQDSAYQSLQDDEKKQDSTYHRQQEADMEQGDTWRRLAMADNMDWIRPLQKLAVPDTTELEGFKINKDINVYIRFSKPVNGYEVTCRFFPYAAEQCETGYMIMRFKGKGNVLIYREEKHCDWQTLNMHTELRWHNNDVYEFDYIAPDTVVDGRPNSYSGSPLGYYTPFQFYDIDFDGEEELLFNDFYRGQGGNHYDAYKIGQGTLTKISDRLPLSELRNDTEIDPKKKTITLSFGDAWSAYDIRFVRMDKEARYLTAMPSLKKNNYTVFCCELLQEYSSTPNIFAVDYIKEQFDARKDFNEEAIDSVYEYRLRGTRLKCVKSYRVKRKR